MRRCAFCQGLFSDRHSLSNMFCAPTCRDRWEQWSEEELTLALTLQDCR